MGEEVDAKLLKQVKVTQEVLGEFVKRPSLTEKHLMRPPFRYLHDVVMTVHESTGFFRGLFTPEELNASSLITKEAKATFIEKVVAVVEITSGEKLEVRASKVLAGQEADRTNALLQTLGTCLKKKQSSNEAVKSVTGVDPGASKGQRRGSTSNEPVKTVAKAPVKTDASKGKKPGPPSKTPVDNSKTNKSRGDAKTGGGTKAAAGPYGKPTTKAAAPPVKTKGKGDSKEPVGNKRGQGQPAPGRPRDRTPDIVDDEENQKVTGTRSRRGSVGSPSTSKTRSRQKSVDQTVAVVEEQEPAPEPAHRSPPPVIGEVEFLSNRFGYQGPGNLRNGQGNNDSEIPGDSSSTPPEDAQVITQPPSPEDPVVIQEQKEIETPEVGEDEEMTTPPVVGAARPKSDAGLTSDDENENENENETDERAVDNLSNNATPTPEAPPPKDVPVKPASGMIGRGRDRSRTSARQRTEPQTRDKEQTDQTENNPPTASTSSSERKLPATSRPPTSSMRSRPPPSARPSSARPAAPRPKTALVVQVDENAFRPPTGKVLNVLMDNDELEEDGDNYIVQELPTSSKILEELDETPELGGFGLGEVDPNVPESQRGLLLNQILETQKELVGGKGIDDGGAGDSERVKYIRESARIEIEKLQNLIQMTAKSAHPLGKLMDFIQEDVDSIHGELNRWQDESRKLDLLLEEELAKTEASLEPLRQELVQIDDAIQDQEDAIDASRMEIQQQEGRIAKILAGFDLIKPVEEFNKTIRLPAVVKVFGIDVELNDEDRELVFGDGSDKTDGIETVSKARTRPNSQYKARQNSVGKLEQMEVTYDPDLEMRSRMKKLASSMARENPGIGEREEGRELTEDEMRSMTVNRQRRPSLSQSPSPSMSPAQSLQYL